MSDIPSKSKREDLAVVEKQLGEERHERCAGDQREEKTEEKGGAAGAQVIPFPTLRQRFGRDNWLGDEWPR